MKCMITMVLVCVTAGCSLPDVQDINLAGCNDTCNAQSKACFANVNDAGTQCLNQDLTALESEAGVDATATEQCAEKQIQAGEDCVNTLISCIDQCIQQTQDQLKK